MSQREELKDPLLEELSNLEVFRRLVRCTPARGKLLRIVAALMSSNKALPRRLSEAYVGRFAVTQSEAEEEDTEQAATSTTAGQDVAERSNCSHESSVATCSTTTTGAAAAAAAVGDSHKKTAAALAAAVIQEIPPPSSPPMLNTLEPLAVHAVVNHESLRDEDALATDLGLRLGSFLSEAGWMQESISVLVCLNERLKHMQPFRDELITRLDCLQRYVPHTNLCHVQFISHSLLSLQSPLCGVLALQFQAGTENLWRTDGTES